MRGRQQQWPIGSILGGSLGLIWAGQLLMSGSPVTGVTCAAVLIMGSWGFWHGTSGSRAVRSPLFLLSSLSMLLALVTMVPESVRTTTLISGGVTFVLLGGLWIHVSGAVSSDQVDGRTSTVPVIHAITEETVVLGSGGLSKLSSRHSLESRLNESLVLSEPFAIEFESETEVATEDRDESEVQRFVRFRASQEERLEGTILVTLERDQRQVFVHLPVVPSFTGVPEGWCECDGPAGLSAEVDELRPFGVRVAVRRSGNDLPAISAQVFITLRTGLGNARAA